MHGGATSIDRARANKSRHTHTTRLLRPSNLPSRISTLAKILPGPFFAHFWMLRQLYACFVSTIARFCTRRTRNYFTAVVGLSRDKTGVVYFVVRHPKWRIIRRGHAVYPCKRNLFTQRDVARDNMTHHYRRRINAVFFSRVPEVLSRPVRDCIFHPSFRVIVIRWALIFGEFIEKFENFPTRRKGG